MKLMKIMKKCVKLMKLFLLFWRRIIFAKDHFDVPFKTKLKMNLCGGYLADQYVLYDFEHNDKDEYLSEFDWYRSRYINEPFDFMMNNKVVCAEVLQQYVRVPKTYAVKNKGFLTSKDDRYSDYEALYQLLEEKRQLFIKPFGAGKGTDVNLFQIVDGKPYIGSKRSSRKEMIRYMQKKDDWMISECMEQHSYASALYDKTVNTIRMITLRDIHTKKIKIFFAVQRIGTSATIPVDNGSRGGLVSKIDLETGRLSEAKSLHSLEVHEVHPDSGAPIKGTVIPQWNEIKKEILDLANKVYFMHFIAWDILVTEEGICIIEANTSSGVNIIQLWGGQRHNELGDFYRFHKVIRK